MRLLITWDPNLLGLSDAPTIATDPGLKIASIASKLPFISFSPFYF
jgi:hypothetical protein